MNEGIDTRERYWVCFDVENLVFRIVIVRCVWDAAEEYIDVKQFDITVDDDYVIIDISLKQPGIPKIPELLSDLLPTLTFVEADIDLSISKQLMILPEGFCAEDGLSGYSFIIATSLEFRTWKGKRNSQLEQEVRDVITSVYHHLDQLADIELIRMDTDQIRITPIFEGFRLVTFGNCACLSYEASSSIETGESDRFINLSSHNIDALAQQLSLFAGLAYLWGKAREDLYGSFPTTSTS